MALTDEVDRPGVCSEQQLFVEGKNGDLSEVSLHEVALQFVDSTQSEFHGAGSLNLTNSLKGPT